MNGLVDCCGGPEEAATQAVEAVKGRQYGCLKIKVPRSCFLPATTEIEEEGVICNEIDCCCPVGSLAVMCGNFFGHSYR